MNEPKIACDLSELLLLSLYGERFILHSSEHNIGCIYLVYNGVNSDLFKYGGHIVRDLLKNEGGRF